jgi:membrane protein implicated in regulation of membrane protease activity
MSEFFATLGLLNLVYLALVVLGFIYALLALLGQGIADLDLPTPDFDLDAGDAPSFDHGEVGLTSISPMSIASFMTAFGAFGLVSAQFYGASMGTSIIFAVVGGLVVGGIAQLLFIYVFSPQTSSLRTQQDVVGLSAEVIIPIPEGGVGQIALVARGSRVTYSARTKPGLSFKQGDLVRVVELVGSVVFVEPR